MPYDVFYFLCEVLNRSCEVLYLYCEVLDRTILNL